MKNDDIKNKIADRIKDLNSKVRSEVKGNYPFIKSTTNAGGAEPNAVNSADLNNSKFEGQQEGGNHGGGNLHGKEFGNQTHNNGAINQNTGKDGHQGKVIHRKA